MKKIFIYIILVIQSWCMLSCYKDQGNYSYHDINMLKFTQIDTVNGYTAFFGDTLNISPVLVNSLPEGEQHEYTYEWSFYDAIKGDRIIATTKNLKLKVAELPGSYTLQYRVTDKSTGVLFHVRTTVLVRTAVYEGYMVLNDVSGKSRLDMLSYDITSNSFAQYTDVLKKMGSSLPAQDKPYKVVCTRVSNAFSYSDSTYGIYMVTASGTNRVHPETFDWRPTYNIRYEVAGSLSADFKAENLFPDPAFYYISIFMSSGNNVYVRSGGVPLYNLPVNKYAGKAPFKASPFMVSNSSQYLTMYNMDTRAFAMMVSLASSTAVDVPVATKVGDIDYPKGGDLLWMDKTTLGFAYAVTKNPTTGACTLTKFAPGSLPVYSKLINGTDIDKATQFAVSAGPEYLFYTVGGKLYEYDLYLETSKLMVDKGSSVISYLAFQKFNKSTTNYSQWAKWLTVGYYDPAGTAGANGTLEQFSVPDVNEALVSKAKWTGLGNITSVSYRER